MKRLTVSILVTLAVLLGSAGESFALPSCPEQRHPTNSPWSNCFGTYTYSSGDKYVGEFKDDKRHGQGTYTFADGRVKEGIWEYGKYLYAKKPSPTVTAKKSPLEKAKEQCAEIGFTKGTEKFGECVMKLLN